MVDLAVGLSSCCCFCCAGVGASTSEYGRRGPAVVEAWKQKSQVERNAGLAVALGAGTSLGFQRNQKQQQRLRRQRQKRLRLGDEVYYHGRPSLPRGAGMRDDAPPEAGEEKSSSKFTSDDLQYLGKLLGGSAAGAALIKYGSILSPQTTQPDLFIALAVITTPVIVSMLLLWWAASSSSRPPSDS